ncbi:MAG: AbrB family transcriptional regulator [Leptolyngbya sp. BL-A-14]
MPTALDTALLCKPLGRLTIALMLVAELLLAFLLGLGLMTIGLGGAAWMIAGIAAGAIVFSVYRSWVDYPLQPNRSARKLGQSIIGLSIGLSLQQSNLEVVAAQLPIFLGLPFFLMLSGGAIGFIYARLESTDLLTALLATTPGNISVMATIAADYSKNTALVSLVQLLRFTTVIFLLPLLVHGTMPPIAQAGLAAFLQQLWVIPVHTLGWSVLLLTIAILAGYVGNRFRMPMAAFFGALIVGLAVGSLPLLLPDATQLELRLPLAFTLTGQALLGITIGEYWGLNPHMAPLTIARAVLPVGLMLLAGFAAAGLIKLLTAWSWLTCLLVTAPGGSPEMIWLALTLHQETEIVTAGHLVRLLAINASLPLLVSVANSLQQRWTYTPSELSD